MWTRFCCIHTYTGTAFSHIIMSDKCGAHFTLIITIGVHEINGQVAPVRQQYPGEKERVSTWYIIVNMLISCELHSTAPNRSFLVQLKTS